MSTTLDAVLDRFMETAGPTLKARNALRLELTDAEADAFRAAQPDQVRWYRLLVCPECGRQDLIRPTNHRRWESFCGSACRARAWRRQRRGVSQPA